MVIFTAPSSTSSVLADPGAMATTFRDNDYIRALNKALRCEYLTIETYLSWGRTLDPHQQEHFARADAHHRSARELVRLIVALRGVAIDEEHIGFAGRHVLSQMGDYIPDALRHRIFEMAIIKSEEELVRQYYQLFNMAPENDREIFLELMNLSKEYLEQK